MLVCDDGGGDPGAPGDPGEPPTDYWTSWVLVGACGGGGGVGGGIIDITTGQVAAAREHIIDGVVVETQVVCIDLEDGGEDAWDAVASAIQALPDPAWHANPDDVTAPGLTGLDTWIWYDQATGVGPISATWTEPVTGLVFGVEGRGWTESVTWDTADGGEYRVFAATWDEHDGIGGTASDPPVTHVYRTKSSAAGFAAGYPVEIDLTWVGEYRVSYAGVWTGWTRFASTLDESGSADYEVIEVRSDLTG